MTDKAETESEKKSRAGKSGKPENRWFSRNREAARLAGAKGGAASKGVKKPRKEKVDG